MARGVLWVKIMDSDGEVEIEELTLNGIGDAIFQCQQLLEELEEQADKLIEQEEENK